MSKKRKRVSEEVATVEPVALASEVKEVVTDIVENIKEVTAEVDRDSKEEVKSDIVEKKVEEPVVSNEEVEKAGVSPLVMDNDKIIDTYKTFGKCRVVADELVVYDRSPFTRNSNKKILKKGDTFYFDRIHITTGNNVYVSWSGLRGRRNYALFKDLTAGTSPVVRISA